MTTADQGQQAQQAQPSGAVPSGGAAPSGGAGPSAEPGPRRLAQRYRLDEVLGRGATGTVWSAYDEVLRRRVAVKEVPPPPGMPVAEADLLRERTLREARAIGVLSHPNVVTLYDVVQQDGEPFVVMELLPARTLASLLAEHGPLGVRGAALVGSAVASALQAAHNAGITHRDVKPGNVLIGDDGRIKLTDFGISRNVAESTLTVTGLTLGSPAFISPEVASGGQVTPAADLWGLGATLFAALEGRPPYDAGGDPLATVNAVVNGEVPVPESAGPLAPVIAGLMVKDAAARMPLDRVRALLHPLVPADGLVPRGRDDAPTIVLGTATLPVEHSTATPASQAAPPASPVGGRANPPPAGSTSATVNVPLAPHPGPLPFQPHARRRHRRSAAATAVLTVASIVLFDAGLGGGFALARAAAGESVRPVFGGATSQPPSAPTSQTTAPPALVSQTLQVDQNDPASTFTVSVPAGWIAYRADLNARPGLASVIVSPDGGSAITVERFADFYPGDSVEDYVRILENELAKAFGEHIVLDRRSNGPLRPGAAEPPQELTYRTVSDQVRPGADGEDDEAAVGRSTFVQLAPVGKDLWVLKVTVASAQEDTARAELFDKVRPTFAPGGA